MLFTTYSHAEAILQDINGERTPLSSLQGKWVFLNYWASWCQPCLDEINELNHFYESNKTKNIVVFAVNFDEPPLYKQQRLSRKFNIHYPSLRYNPAKLFHLGNISVVPVTFVFNPQGQLSATLYGGQTLASLNEVITTNITTIDQKASYSD
jgi:thiol-disulfide isomerase/thioredoxin